MPLPDERPRQSVANLIGKFEQGGKRGSGSNGSGVARRQSQGVLGSTTPAMPLKAQYTGQSTSAISVQSGPRSPPIKASELTNTTGTDVPSWRKTTLPQATVPPAPEIPQPESTLQAGTELQEINPPSIIEQQVISDEPTAIPVPTEPDQVTAPNERTTPRTPPEKSTRTKKTTSNTSVTSTAKPKVVPSIGTKPTAPGPSKTTKSPPSSRPSTLSKATASGAAKYSRPSVVPPPVAPLKPQFTGGSATASRLSAPTAASKARIASGATASSSTNKPSVPSSSMIKRAATGPTSPPRKLVPKSKPMVSSTLIPAKKAPLPRSTVSKPKAPTSTPPTVRKLVPSSSTNRTATSSKTPAVKPMPTPRVGLAGAGRVKNPSGPAELAAAGGVITGVPATALLQGDKKEATTKEPPVAAEQLQEITDLPLEAETQTQDEGLSVAPEMIMESVNEPGDQTVMQKSDAEEVHLDETDSHGEPVGDHLDDASSHEELAEEHLDETSSQDLHEGEMSMELEDAEGEYHEEVMAEGGDEGDVYDLQPPEEIGEQEEVHEDQDQANSSAPPSHTEEPPEHTSTPSEDGGGGDLEDAVALLEGGNPHKMAQPVDLFSPGYTGENGERRTTLAQEASPNPSQREVGDIPDDE